MLSGFELKKQTLLLKIALFLFLQILDHLNSAEEHI